MKNPDKKFADGRSAAAKRLFKLFIAGDEPNSRAAKLNFETIRSLIDSPCECEIIDVLEDFRAALSYEILVTPTLLQVFPTPAVTVMGNLSETARVMTALGIRETADEG